MRKITFILLLSFVSLVGKATVYLDETFNYTTGAALSACSGWTAAGTLSTGIEPVIDDTPLIYSNSGGDYTLSNSGKTVLQAYVNSATTNNYYVSKPFNGAAITSGVIYLSFLYSPNSVSQSQAGSTAIYLGGTTNGAQFWVGRGAINTSNFRFGVTRSSTSNTLVAWNSTEYSSNNTVYFIVLKYDFSAGAASIFVNPTIASESEPTPSATDNSVSTAPSSLQNVVFKMNSNNKNSNKVSGVRVSGSWAEAVAKYVSPATPLSTPINISTTATSNTGFSSSWDAVPNALSYIVKTYIGGTNLVNTTEVASGTSASISGLMSGLDYTYKVTAVGDGTTYSNSESSAISVQTTGRVSTIITDFNDNTWGTIATSLPESGAYGSATINGFDLTSTFVYSGSKTGPKGESHTNRLALDKSSTSASVMLPTLSSVEQIEVHATFGSQPTAGTPKTFTLEEYIASSNTWSVVETYSQTDLTWTTSGDVIFITNISRSSAVKLRIANKVSSGLYICQIIARTTAPVLLITPTLTGASALTATTATLNWNATTNASGYKVYVYKTGSLQSGYPVSVGAVTTLDITGLTSATEYTYIVQATGDSDVSYSDSYLSGSTAFTTGTQLSKPTVSDASNIYSSGFTASWTTSENASGYVVKTYLQGSASSFNTTNVSGQAVGSVIVTGLDPETIYTYKVYATGDNVTYFNSSYSVASTEFTTKKLVSISGTSSASVDLTTLALTDDILVGSGGTLNLDESVSLNKITVAAGGKLTLADTKSITANSIILQSDNTGTATFLDENAAGATVTGTIQQHLTSGRNWYMSSPIASATASALSLAGSVVYYDEPTAAWVPITSGTSLNLMQGYISANTSGTGAVSFTGTFNSGEKYIDFTRTASVAKTGFNLAGNPYPSFVSWDAATKTNLEPTIWYRSKNAGNTAYIFDTYNATTQIGTGLNGTNVTTLIPPMQAFWVRVSDGNTTGRLTLNNSMRSHGSGINRLKAPGIASQQILRLRVSNGTNSDEAIVVFNDNASNSFDNYDSRKMSNSDNAVPEIYTVAANEELVINGMNTNNAGIEIPVGFRTGEMNSFSIQATEISNFSSGTGIILQDNVLNTQTDLTVNPTYTFSSDVTETSSRFSILVRAPGAVTGLNEENLSKNCHVFANNDHQIVVKNTSSQSVKFSMYNLYGQSVMTEKLVSNASSISSVLSSGIYFITLLDENNNQTIYKVKVN